MTLAWQPGSRDHTSSAHRKEREKNKSKKRGQAINLKAYTSFNKAFTPKCSITFSNSTLSGGQAVIHVNMWGAFLIQTLAVWIEEGGVLKR